jgi:uncharacterized protein YxjI
MREDDMGLRDRRENRRDERRDDRRGAPDPDVYQIKARLIDIGDDYWIETTAGRRAYKVDGKVLRIRDTFDIKDANGAVVAQLQERMVRVRDTMAIDRPGRPSASIQKAMITPLRERWTIKADDAGEISVQGNILDHEYTFERDGQRVAEVSKRWVRVRDTYGVSVQPGVDVPLILAATVAIDAMRKD